MILKWSEVEKVDPPQKPKIPISPIPSKAIKSALGPFGMIMDIAEMANERKNEYYGDGKYKVQPKSLISKTVAQYIWGESVDNNVAEISARELLHRSDEISGDFCVIPQAKGTYIIRIKLMCEEYIEPDVQEIQLIVE